MGKSQKSRKVQKKFSRKSKYGGSKMYLMEGGADTTAAETDDEPKKPEIKQNIIDKVNKLADNKNSDEIVDALFDDSQIPKLKDLIKKLIDENKEMDSVVTSADDKKKTYNFTNSKKNKEIIRKILKDFDYIDDLLNSITEFNVFKELENLIDIDKKDFNFDDVKKENLDEMKKKFIEKVKNISADNREVKEEENEMKERLEKEERTEVEDDEKYYVEITGDGISYDDIKKTSKKKKKFSEINNISENGNFAIIKGRFIVEFINKGNDSNITYLVLDEPIKMVQSKSKRKKLNFETNILTCITTETKGKSQEDNPQVNDPQQGNTPEDKNISKKKIKFQFKKQVGFNDLIEIPSEEENLSVGIKGEDIFGNDNYNTDIKGVYKIDITYKVEEPDKKADKKAVASENEPKNSKKINITSIEYDDETYSGISNFDYTNFKIALCKGDTQDTFEGIYYSLGDGKTMKLNKIITVKGDFEGEKTNLFSYMYTMFIPVHSGIKTGMFMAGSTGDIKTKFQLSFNGSEPGIGKGKESGSGANVKLSDPEGEPRKTSIGTVKHIVNQLNQNDKGVWGYTRIICEEIGSTNTEAGKKQITNEPGFLVTQEINKGVRYEKMHFQASAILVEICNSIVHRHDNTSGNYYNIPFFDNISKVNSKSEQAVNDKDSVNSRFASFSFINKHLNSVRLGDYMAKKNDMSISSFRRVEYVTNLNQPDTGASKYEFDDENKIYIVPGLK